MSREPGSAEELYGLVCALQKEQQLTQVELREVQQRTETLRRELHHQEAIIAEEQARQEELAANLTLGHAERRLAEAHARGAVRASDDAARQLRSQRQAFVRKCHDYVCSLGRGPTEASLSGGPRALSMHPIPSPAAGESCSAPPGAETANAHRDASLMAPAAVNRLLLLLKEKLTRCVEVSATAAHGSLQASLLVSPVTERSPREQPRGGAPPSTQGTAATAGAAAMAPRIAYTSPHQPLSPSTAVGCVYDAIDEQLSPREKKRIGFAPASCFERVTVVPAANVNRNTRQTQPTEGRTAACNTAAAAPPSADVVSDRDNRPSQTHLRNGSLPRTQRFRGNFAVRVASRSAMLVAEAAAVGAKRQRASEAARSIQFTPPKAARADDVQEASACSAPQCASAAAVLASVCAKDRGRLVAPAELLSQRSAVAGQSGNNVSGRRTVWTWTRDTLSTQ
ncbi:hypothetical protein LSCM1_01882 [Leishmania martiniquensis]|uniref:Uncharacterized protein n=1 Tax=Leishmania martiniquensis TaxID=1580590 RepID=A0A836H4B7_9TRYP|nr:hypothetical protein LSCM1_01882 [Leishmania martiniquensis]